MSKELETIFGVEKEIEVSGHKVKIKTLSLGDLPVVSELIEKVVAILPDFKRDANAAIIKFIKSDFQSVIKLLGATTSLDDKEVARLNPAAAVVIVSAVIKENSSFLADHVAPQIAKATKEIGSMVSKSSSATDTALKT